MPLAGNSRAALLAAGTRYGFNGESNDCHDLVAYAPNQWRLSYLEVDNAREENILLVDNGAGASGRTSRPAALRLGDSGLAIGRKLAADGEYLNGEIAEILVYDRVLARDEQRQVQAYLDEKWGLDCLGWFRTPDGRMLVFDFEEDTYEGWQVEGTAFGTGPARGTLPGQMPVAGFLGRGLANSYLGADGATGRLTSPEFVIERRYINFLIGGGKYPGTACVNLRVEGRVVRTATGPNDKPGGSERLDWASWDVAEFRGKTATIEIVDQATLGWGHINVDQITQGDTKKEEAPGRREIAVERAYLHLPVKDGGPGRHMRFLAGDKVVREFDIELADAEPDFWVFSDVAAFKGQRLRIEVDRLADGSRGLEAIRQADTLPDAETLYKEKHRPQFHFSPRRGWNNDPNGLVFHKGEYHLYFQHNPYGWGWGNMHWGHAVSKDLVHWTELPIALYPHTFGDWVFSGSAVVDTANTAGFKAGAEDVIVAAYTSTGRGEAIAFSNDRGRTFTDYAGNPVVKHRGRDPKVIWYAPGKHWVMAVYDEQGEGENVNKGIAFYTSPDLKQWQLQSRIEGYYECPEIFEIPVDGNANNRKWVVYAADGAYAVGAFDGKSFAAESGKHRYNWGTCFYASQTFNNLPAEDGRRVQIAWGTMATPGMPFNQMMGFPVELTLRTTEEGPRLFANPVREIEKLHGKKHSLNGRTLQEGENPLADITGDLFDIRAEIAVGDAAQVGFTLRGVPVLYDVKQQQILCRDKAAPLKLEAGKIRLRLLVDRTSIEIFGNDGRVYMPMGIIAPDDNKTLELFARGGTARAEALEVAELRSSWE